MQNNKFTNVLLCILIIFSAANLFVGINNHARINRLENAPPVIIEEYPEKQDNSTTAEPELTFKNKETEKISDEEITSTVCETESEKTPSTKPDETLPDKADNLSVCFVTASGTKYHREGCSYLKKSKTKLTVSEAQSSGYSPCSRCY